ncbi:patatin-like phospholipase family protein [Ensifer aridi]|uniref:patatin-like phospholipase family protein n=1 Tax=Ensifer aridi TaxID=1708715 RepID=UPI000A121EC1|nr:patatin-like phospholipase family protein [Ensifer aridi]
MEECDLVMKGGITSGVVYPHAIAEIATRYRLRSIGGTSAGAIAATFAAAAEFRRQNQGGTADGFNDLRAVADSLANDLKTLFQPSPKMRPLYDLMIAAIEAGETENKFIAVARSSFRVFFRLWLCGAALALAGIVAGYYVGSFSLALFGILAGLCLAVGLVAWRLYFLTVVGLPAENYGVCPGLTQAGSVKPAFTNWMADRIDEIAGNLGPDGRPAAPLTVGQLQAFEINVAAMTTDLSSGRPYQLPLRSDIHYFSRREFGELFPKRIMDHLVREENRLETDRPDLPGDLYKLPVDTDMPVLLVARLSLSFPGLIRAVPLYRYDDEIKLENGAAIQDSKSKIRRCLFSDGGISSNFPIHFFDAFLPSRPTFGITLVDYSEDRHVQERVWLPQDVRTRSTALAVDNVASLLGFLMTIVNTAKDWQDTLQTKLPGYAERIVEVRLDKAEGGMNLSMPKDIILRLSEYGRQAGRQLVDHFDFNEHRWRRALSFLDRMENGLTNLARNYDVAAPGGHKSDLTLPQVLTDHAVSSYPNSPDWRRDVLKAFADALSVLGRDAAEAIDSPARQCIREGNVPHIDAHIQLAADADHVPAATAHV